MSNTEIPAWADVPSWIRKSRTATQPVNYAIPSGRWPTVGAGVTSRPTLNQALGQSSIPGGYMSPSSMGPTLDFSYGVVSESALQAQFMMAYPYMAAFMNHPEVGKAIREVAASQGGIQELYGKITQTEWWKTSGASDRAWQVLLAEDPAEAARRSAMSAAHIQNTARSLGLNMSDDAIMQLANDVNRYGWTDEEQIDRLVASVNWGTLQGGSLTAYRDLVKSIGADYMVNVSDSTAQNYALAIASGEMTQAGVASVMQAQARARFGFMADEIDQGITPSQYFMPIRDKIAQTLEMAPESVNLMDSQWLSMVEIHDRETGKTRAATLHEAELAARRRPEWQQTNAAGDLMSRAATSIAQMFGRRTI